MLGSNGHIYAQQTIGPETVSVQSDSFELKGLFWQPSGRGPFPAIIFCHGSYESSDTRYDLVQQMSLLGQLFVEHGFIFFGLCRRGAGLSKKQGENSADILTKVFKEKGQEERNKVQIQKLQGDDLQDMLSGLAFLRRRKETDSNHIAVLGHSFGGSLALLVAEHEPDLKAVVIFAAGGYSWNLSPQLRTRLFKAVKKINVPTMIVHAQNDYSLSPGFALDSVMNLLNKPHKLKIYRSFGSSPTEGHNILFLSTATWLADVLRFLHEAFNDKVNTDIICC